MLEFLPLLPFPCNFACKWTCYFPSVLKMARFGGPENLQHTHVYYVQTNESRFMASVILKFTIDTIVLF